MRIYVKHVATQEGVRSTLTQIDEEGYTHGEVTVSREVRYGEMQSEPVFNWKSSSMASSWDDARDQARMMAHALTIANTFALALYDEPRLDLLDEDQYRNVIAEYDL